MSNYFNMNLHPLILLPAYCYLLIKRKARSRESHDISIFGLRGRTGTPATTYWCFGVDDHHNHPIDRLDRYCHCSYIN
jgi:hypothetical protein